MNAAEAKQFVLAGKAIFTVSNPQEEHYTYKIEKAKDAEKWFVKVLTGPDNNANYSYMGMIRGLPGQWVSRSTIEKTAASKIGPDALSWKVLDWAMGRIFAEVELPTGYRFQHEGRCGRCGRRLTVPSSIDNGIGPECIKYLTLAAV